MKRIVLIQELWWERGTDFKKGDIGKLCESEKKYLVKYDRLVKGYMENIKMPINKELSPPKCLYVEIDVPKTIDDNEIITLNEKVILLSGTRMLVLHEEVEHLLRTGKVKKISNIY